MCEGGGREGVREGGRVRVRDTLSSPLQVSLFTAEALLRHNGEGLVI